MSLKTLYAKIDPENLRTAFHAATAQDTADGLAWYINAHSAAALYAHKYSYSIEQAAAVIAVLSPRLHWNVNLVEAENIIRAHANGQRDPALVPSRAWPANVRKAFSILSGDLTALSGNKVRDFCKNILAQGESDSPCIDTWIVRAAIGEDWNPSRLTGTAYRKIAAAVQSAAQDTGLPAAIFQAIVWVYIRRTAAAA